MRTLLITLLFPLALSAGPVAAEDAIDPPTRAAVQGVITKQLEALAREDGSAAEEFASKAIREKFRDGSAFLAMVHKNYGALIHPKGTAFGATEPSPHGPLQTVTIVAADGTVWTAIYSFEQDGGTWRITGCGLARNEGQQDI